MTERLYYQDAYLVEFEAQVVKVEPAEGGFRVYLDRTAFYPESGGQPADAGWLDGQEVRYVGEDDGGDVYHRLDQPPGSATISGKVEFARRFDHMQQHSGQHIISAAFVQLYQVKTVGFHLSADFSSVDMAAPAVSPKQLQSAMVLANRVVWEDRPVTISFHQKETADSIGLRKPTQREGEIRVVEISGFDRSACGGTHVRRTGEVGQVLILKTEKMKDKTRLYFVCGGRALNTFLAEHAVLEAISAQTTTGFPELPGRVEKLLQTVKTLERECSRLKNELLERQVPAILAEHTGTDGVAVVVRAWDGEGQAVRFLCQRLIAGAQPALVALGAPADGQLCLGRTAGLAADLTHLAARLRERHGVKGGGRPDFVQMGGIPRDDFGVILQQCEQWFKEWKTQ